MASDRTGGASDATVETAEEPPAAEQPPPPDRPGAEGIPSRAESRNAVAAGEKANDQPTEEEPGKDEPEASPAPQESTREQDTEAAQDTVESPEPAESSAEASEQTETPSDETTVEQPDTADVEDDEQAAPADVGTPAQAQDSDATGTEDAAEPADSTQVQEDEDGEDAIPAEDASETAEPLPDDSEDEASNPEEASGASDEGRDQGVRELEETTPEHEADEGTEQAESVEPLTDAEYAEHVRDVAEKLDQASAQGSATDHVHTVDPNREHWSKDRNRIHREIVTDMYAKAADVPNDHEAVMAGGLGGLGGAGKSTVLENYAGIDQSQYLTINPDDIKEELARRNLIPAVAGLSPMEASNLVHEESSHIAKALAARSYADGKNVIWDITMSSAGSTEKRVEALRDAGYRKIEGVFVDIPVETSVRRAQSRHRRGHEAYRNGKGEGGRYVPDEVIRANEDPEWGSANRRTFEQLKQRFDVWSVYDNSVDGGAPVLLDSSDREKEKA